MANITWQKVWASEAFQYDPLTKLYLDGHAERCRKLQKVLERNPSGAAFTQDDNGNFWCNECGHKVSMPV